MCFAKKKQKPTITLLEISSEEVGKELASHGIKVEVMLRDSSYFYCSASDWAKVFSYIYFDSPMPVFIAERMDCDDFAIWMKGLVSAHFGLNTCGAVMGNCHQWNLFRTDAGWMELEPQNGEMFELGQKGYSPEWILI